MRNTSTTLQHSAPFDGSDIDWVRLLELIQNPQTVHDNARHYVPYRARDIEEGGDDESTSAAGSSSAGPSSPGQPSAQASHGPSSFAATFQQNQFTHPSDPEPTTLHPNQQLRQQLLAGGSNGASTASALPLLGLLTLTRRTPAAGTDAAGAGGPSMVDPAADPDASSVPGSAQRHRLISERTGVSRQVLGEWIADLVPFLLLLMWVFIFRHIATLVLILLLGSCILRANDDIRRLIALRREAGPATCLAQAATAVLYAAAAVALTLPDRRLLRVLSLRTISSASAIDSLLLVLLADSVVRLASLGPKLLVVAWFRSRGCCSAGLLGGLLFGGGGGVARGAATSAAGGSGGLCGGAAGGAGCGGGGGCGGSGGGGLHYLTSARRQRQQSRVLTAAERAVALYRSVLPGPVWYSYLLRGGGFSPVMASLMCGFYLALKAPYVATQAHMLALALKVATRRGSLYGTYVGRSDGSEAGTFGACPVCQDPVSIPVRLDCGHIFCEECILEWLERDRTCPMCRAEVRPAGLPACSDGTSPLLPQIF